MAIMNPSKLRACYDALPHSNLSETKQKALEALITKYLNGELVPVVHGRWEIICASSRSYCTEEYDEDFYMKCSECGRMVFDISQDDAMVGNWKKIFNEFPYCHCGAQMDGGKDDG